MLKSGYNPILPLDVYIPDGEPHVFDDRIYLFGSHEKENGPTFCMLDYEIWSAPLDNLSDWTSKGINYRAKQDPLYNDKLKYMYAPDCVKGQDGRYYLYYCLAGYKGRGGYSNPISIAVSDSPDGQYEYYGVVQNLDGTPMTHYVCFDPAVINDDGIIRLYYGTSMPWVEHVPFEFIRNRVVARIIGRKPKDVSDGIIGAYHVELADDMKTIQTSPVRIDDTITGIADQNQRFFEASSIRKVKDTYYFIYSSINNHELCYATSKRPDSNFIFGGTIISNGDIGLNGRLPEDRVNHTGTNHGSIEYINQQWYVFYHRLTHNSDYSRQACVEKIHIREDGSIPQVEITSNGFSDSLPVGGYPAVICCQLTNGRMKHGANQKKDTDEPMIYSDGMERFISKITKGTRIGYKYFTFGGNYNVKVTIRSTGTGTIDVFVGNDEVAAGAISINPCTEWTTYTCALGTIEGQKALYFSYSGQGTLEFLDFYLEKTGDENLSEKG